MTIDLDFLQKKVRNRLLKNSGETNLEITGNCESAYYPTLVLGSSPNDNIYLLIYC
jgi:hypothetical protein